MGGNRKRPDRSPRRLGKKLGPGCHRAAGHRGIRASKDSKGPVETFKHREGPVQERSLVASKMNHYKPKGPESLDFSQKIS